MIKKGQRAYSALFLKCPRCHEGDLFENKNPYSLKMWDKMKPHCENCGQSFEPETGFYYGSMYVSYGVTVFISIVVFAISFLIFNADLLTFIFINALVLILLMPYTFRLSRAMWLGSFVKYEKDVKKITKP